MRHGGAGLHAARLRALVVVLCRAGLRFQEALALAEADLEQRRGSLLVRRRKGGRRREVGMDDWAWEPHLQPSLHARVDLPVGPLLCIATGPPRARAWSAGAARVELRQAAARAGVRRRFPPHQLRHAHAVEMAREGVPLIVFQRQLGHTNLGITAIYLQGIDCTEIIDTVHALRPPMMPVDATLRLRRRGAVGRRPLRESGGGTPALPFCLGGALNRRVSRVRQSAEILGKQNRSPPLSIWRRGRPCLAQTQSRGQRPATPLKGSAQARPPRSQRALPRAALGSDFTRRDSASRRPLRRRWLQSEPEARPDRGLREARARVRAPGPHSGATSRRARACWSLGDTQSRRPHASTFLSGASRPEVRRTCSRTPPARF
jgi:hypothetical protein